MSTFLYQVGDPTVDVLPGIYGQRLTANLIDNLSLKNARLINENLPKAVYLYSSSLEVFE
jgi:hypothetical protein